MNRRGFVQAAMALAPSLAMARHGRGGATQFADPTTIGPYTVSSYTSGIGTNANIGLSEIWYPVGQTSLAGVVCIGGLDNDFTEAINYFTNGGNTYCEQDTTEWTQLLASHGFAAMFINPSNLGTDPNGRKAALLAAVDILAAENARVGSPLNGKLQVNNMAVMGHSFGGAAALFAAGSGSSARIQAAVGCSPVTDSEGTYSDVMVPAMVLCGQMDSTGTNFATDYATLPSATSKVFCLFTNDGSQWQDGHDITYASISHLLLGTTAHTVDPTVAKLLVSFMRFFLLGQSAYLPYLSTGAGVNTFSSANL